MTPTEIDRIVQDLDTVAKSEDTGTRWIGQAASRGIEAIEFLRAHPVRASAVPEWTKASAGHPKPHAKYLLRRDGYVHTVTPCYGMHAPWWVPMGVDGSEYEPTDIQPTDEWAALSPQSASEPTIGMDVNSREAALWTDNLRLRAALEPFAEVARGDRLNPTPEEWQRASAVHTNTAPQTSGS